MPPDNPTLEEFPDIFSDAGTSPTTESDVQMLPWPFCFRYNTIPWSQQSINAPSPDTAAITAGNLVQLLNNAAPGLGYQPLFSATAGNCQ